MKSNSPSSANQNRNRKATMNPGKALELSTILIADDDQILLHTLATSLRKRGFNPITADTISKATTLQQQHRPASAVVDLKIGSESGLRLISLLRNVNPDIEIIVLTGYASIATAVSAIKLGAKDYLCKPVDTLQILSALNISQRPHEPGPVIPETRMPVYQLEWEYLQKVLLEHNGNISAAARSLGMHRRTLQRKLNKRSGSR
ncbi:response regulator transcription factor [Endozoicomonas sp. GU-1]|uniref:response regulator transcription factor n=2 Tax=Endozoicomonas TaxID=305899 RepID=UPI0022B50910|nr:response regulator [Endozoicomonas sp. GU-1]WBA80788.1 response regulator [Endozoicomonas sp. GU-1]WBA88351.1 response regulator [Endozoicomonas sp. GU-1]